MTTAILSPGQTPVDLELAPHVRAAAGGDTHAFERLVNASSNAVAAIALAICRDVAASEDVAQEVYLVAWRRLKELRNPASFLPWVRQIARYTAQTWVRGQRLRRASRGGRLDDPDALLDRAVDPRPGAEATLLDGERDRLVREALDALPEESREVLTLYYREGRSSRQVARLLGLSDAAVRQRLSRARRTLKEEVLDHFAVTAGATAPGVAFTAAVMTTIAAPTLASAATGVAGAAGAVGSSLGWKILLAIGGAGAGAAAAIGGVVVGLRRDFRDAVDAEERRQLRSLRRIAVVTVLLCGGAWMVEPLNRHWLGPVAIFLTLLTSIGILYLVWLPRLLRRRFWIETGGDRAEVQRRLRRRRWCAWLGFLAGALSGGAGLMGGLVKNGLL
jgi:RNA polymerase sigma factor (sigma-70 family)